MNLYIDNRSGAPIYDQIYTQIKNQIISGELEADQALPSIRNLAKDLRISVITTKRAYEELEREGFLYTLPGKGCFAAQREDVDQNRRTSLLTVFDRTAAELLFLGMSTDELCHRLRQQTGKEAAQ